MRINLLRFIAIYYIRNRYRCFNSKLKTLININGSMKVSNFPTRKTIRLMKTFENYFENPNERIENDFEFSSRISSRLRLP